MSSSDIGYLGAAFIIFLAVNSESSNCSEEDWFGIKGYRDNYVSQMPEFSGNEKHSEFFFSFWHPITDENAFFQDISNFSFISYVGKFDFFWVLDGGETRASGPVVNRLNNPEIHYRIGWLPFFGQTDPAVEYLDLAFGHESNGQTIDDVDTFYREIERGRNAIDSVSRGWDYISLEARSALFGAEDSNGNKGAYLTVNLRNYFQNGGLSHKEDDIFWDITNSSRIEEFDGLRLSFEYKRLDAALFNDSGAGGFLLGANLSIDIRTGISSAFDNVSTTTDLSFLISILDFHLPLFVRYFDGYGDEIVRYHEHSSYRAFGLKFAF